MAYGQNPYSAGEPAGTKEAEGKILTLLASGLTGPTTPPAAGDPVYIGSQGGVALETASATTDYIAVDTEGIYNLSVVASDAAGTSAVAIGDEIFISTAGVLSKIASGKFFGIALSASGASASAAVIPVLLGGRRGAKPMKGQRFTASYNFAAADVAKTAFIAPAACALISAVERHGTVAGQAGTLNVEKCNTGEAATSGDVMLATGWDLTSTINTPVTLAAVTDGKQLMVAGDAIFLKVTAGAATSLVNANITFLFEWL